MCIVEENDFLNCNYVSGMVNFSKTAVAISRTVGAI